MSGNAEIPDAVRAMHAGARDFLIKPFDKNALTEAMAAGGKEAKRAFEAMMKMKKIDVAAIEKARRG